MTLGGEVHHRVGTPQRFIGDSFVEDRTFDESDARVAQHVDDVLATPG